MSQPTAKPSVFIASSLERIHVARAVQEELDYDARCTVWSQAVFRPSERAVDSLVRIAWQSEFGVFVFHPEDFATIRDKTTPIARDNVVFELGLFIGALGPGRCFILLPRGRELHLPSDLVGVTPIDYDGSHVDENAVAAVGAACNKIRRELQRARSPRRRRAASVGGGAEEDDDSEPAPPSRQRMEGRVEVIHGLLADYLDNKVGLVACLDQLRKYDPDALLPIVLRRQYDYAVEDFDAPGYPPPRKDLADSKMGRLGHVVTAVATWLGDDAAAHFVSFGSFLVQENARLGRGWRESAVAKMAVYFKAESLRSVGSEELHQAVLRDIARSAPNGDPGFILRPRMPAPGTPGSARPGIVPVFLADGRNGGLVDARWRTRKDSGTIDLVAYVYGPEGTLLGSRDGTVIGSCWRIERTRWRFASRKVPTEVQLSAGDSDTEAHAREELLGVIARDLAPRIREILPPEDTPVPEGQTVVEADALVVEVQNFDPDFDAATGRRLRMDVVVTNRGADSLQGLGVTIIGFGTRPNHAPVKLEQVRSKGNKGSTEPPHTVPLSFDERRSRADRLRPGESAVAHLKPSPSLAMPTGSHTFWAGCLRVTARSGLPEPVLIQLLFKAVEGEGYSTWTRRVDKGKAVFAVHDLDEHGTWVGPIDWFDEADDGSVTFKVVE